MKVIVKQVPTCAQCDHIRDAMAYLYCGHPERTTLVDIVAPSQILPDCPIPDYDPRDMGRYEWLINKIANHDSILFGKIAQIFGVEKGIHVELLIQAIDAAMAREKE